MLCQPFGGKARLWLARVPGRKWARVGTLVPRLLLGAGRAVGGR